MPSNLRPRGLNVPIYALTANAMKADIEKSLQAGCNGHLCKPIDRSVVLDTLGCHLKLGPAQNMEMSGTSTDTDSSDSCTSGAGTFAGCTIDWQGLQDRLDDERLILSMFTAWLRAAPDHLRNLLYAMQEGDMEGVRRAAHALKGSAATIGAPRLARAAGTVEVAAKSGAVETARGLIPQVEFELHQVQSLLSRPDCINAIRR